MRKPTADDLHSEFDKRRVDFLTADLKVCFTFARVAETELKIGDREAANRALAKAERGYETISRFLSDPKHNSHLAADELQKFKVQLQQLRDRLDGF